MYSPQEIEKILGGVLPKLKKYDMQTSNGRECPWSDFPEYWKGYKSAIKQMNAIKVHAEIGDFPDQLFKVRAPNQTEKEFEYIKANYKQNTMPVFMDYISTMQRPFFDGNWSINYQTKQWDESLVSSGNTLQDYVEQEITPVGTLEEYMKYFVVQTKAVDANGVIAVKPKDIPLRENELGQIEIDNTEMFEPLPYYYSVDKKVAYEPNKYYLIRTDEKSEVIYGNRKESKGHIFEFYDEMNLWKVVQTGNFVDYTFEYYLYFEHGWGRVPVIDLMGVPQCIEENRTIWTSHFYFAVPNLNNALINTQYLNASTAKCMFPHTVVLGRVCSFEWKDKAGQLNPCMDGRVYDSEKQGYIECPSCKGTGLADRLSPLGELRLNPDSDYNKGDASLGSKALQFISPETSSLEFVRELIIKDFDDARKMLHQQTSNSVVKGTENLTATGMSLDTKAMYAFVKTPSDQVFSIYEFCIDAIGFMRYGEKYVKAIITTPQTFDYNTDQDYLALIADGQKAGLPPFVIDAIMFRYLQTLYYNEREQADIFSLIFTTDRILTLTQDDIILKFTRGLIQDWEITLHDSAKNLVSDLILENPDFIDLDFVQKQEMLIAKAKEKTVSQNPGQAAVQRVLA